MSWWVAGEQDPGEWAAGQEHTHTQSDQQGTQESETQKHKGTAITETVIKRIIAYHMEKGTILHFHVTNFVKSV